MNDTELRKLVEDQAAKLTQMQAKLEALEKAQQPHVPTPTRPATNYLDYLSMPPEALRDLVNGVPDSVVRDIAADAHRGSPTGPLAEKPVERGSGWQKDVPFEPPPGIALCDKLVDAQDARDKLELAARLSALVKARSV